MAAGPRAAYNVRYDFSAPAQAPISTVSISLQDYSREVVVRGTSRDQVASLAAAVKESLNESTTPIGGSTHRLIAGAVVIMIFALLAVLLPPPITPDRLPHFAVRYILLLLLLILIVFVPSWERVLPGTIVLSHDAPFLARNGPAISFASLVIGIVALVIPSLQRGKAAA